MDYKTFIVLGIICWSVGCTDGIRMKPDNQAVYLAGESCIVNHTDSFEEWENRLNFCHQQWVNSHYNLTPSTHNH